MTDTTAILGLPYLLPSQAQKHVTHNEALRQLDALVQLSAAEIGAETPPADPAEGDLYILGTAPTGAWAGQAGALALWEGSAWAFIAPREGWRAWDRAAGALRVWTGADWAAIGGGAATEPPEVLPRLGIATGADDTNRLSVQSAAALFTHDGAGHQIKVNKATTGDTASLLFQSGYTGHAEMGLAGEIGFSIKVSADGSAWSQALAFDAATGQVSGGAAVQSGSLDATAGRLMPVGAFGLGAETPPVIADFTAALMPGFYRFAENAATGAPGSGASFQGYAMVTRALNGAAMVLAARQTSNPANQRAWIGTRTGATGALTWQELFQPGNVVGTVAQSGGVPTGAVVESGSNVNGSYVRWADGTQICTNGNAAITTDPAAFTGPVTSIDGDKLRIGRWF